VCGFDSIVSLVCWSENVVCRCCSTNWWTPGAVGAIAGWSGDDFRPWASKGDIRTVELRPRRGVRDVVYEEVVVLSKPFDEVLAAVKTAFAAEGFGTLTEIDLQATLAKKVNKVIDRYTILGMCNPQLASRALDVLPQIGVLLPCNVVVREAEGDVVVEAMDPGLMANLTGLDDIAPIADDARQFVSNALGRLTGTD
jgi:uncharacterized protein (DUF302 family)